MPGSYGRCRACPTLCRNENKISQAEHNGLSIEYNDASGLSPSAVEKIQLHDIPSWKVHHLTGDRKGTWSLTVTRNWRITFAIDPGKKEIFDLDYEDYH